MTNKELEKILHEFSNNVIGVMKVDNQFFLVTSVNWNDNSVSAISISTFGVAQTIEYLQFNQGKLKLFSKDRTLKDMIKEDKYLTFLKKHFNVN